MARRATTKKTSRTKNVDPANNGVTLHTAEDGHSVLAGVANPDDFFKPRINEMLSSDDCFNPKVGDGYKTVIDLATGQSVSGIAESKEDQKKRAEYEAKHRITSEDDGRPLVPRWPDSLVESDVRLDDDLRRVRKQIDEITNQHEPPGVSKRTSTLSDSVFDDEHDDISLTRIRTLAGLKPSTAINRLMVTRVLKLIMDEIHRGIEEGDHPDDIKVSLDMTMEQIRESAEMLMNQILS